MNDLTIEEIAKYNLANGTHFYKAEQVLADMKIKRDYESAKATDPADRNPREAYLASFDTAPSSEKVKYNWDDPSKRTVASGLGAAFTLPAMAGEFATYGLLGGASRIAGGMLGSTVGGTGGAWLGNKADEAIGNGKHTWSTVGGIAGGFAGWNPGSRLLYKNVGLNLGKTGVLSKYNTNRFNKDVIGNAFSKGVKKIKLNNSLNAEIFNPENALPFGSYYQSPEQMAERINKLSSEGFVVFGHGTGYGGKEAARNIEKEGLKIFNRYGNGLTDDADITNTAAVLGGSNDASKLANWPHLKSRYISLFPSAEFRYVGGDRRYFDLFPKGTFKFVPETKGTSFLDNFPAGWTVAEGNKGGITKPSASMGYYDSKTNIFTPNPNYQYRPYIKQGKTFRLGLGNPNATFRTTRKGFRVPTNVSENEALGLPKYERNNIPLDGNQNVDMTKVLIKRRDGQFKPAHIDYEYPALSDRLEYGDIYSIDGKTYKRGSSGQFTKNNLTDSDQIRVLQRNGYSPWEYNYVLKQNRNGADPINMIEYAKTLPEPNIETTPFKGNDWFNYFDMFYENLGYDTSRMSPIDKLKIMEDSYNQLMAGSTGKLKGRIFWNGNPDRYTWSDSGPVLIRKGIPDKLTSTPTGVKSVRTSTSDNHGYYFGFQPFVQYSYPTMGRTYADQMIRLVPKARADMQPYMVNDINTIYERLPEGLHGKIPKNTVVNPSTSKGNSPIHYINGTSSEIGVGHGTSIKSIFPHPEAFIKGDDGIVTLTRDWKNPDVHLKQGGILKRVKKGQNGLKNLAYKIISKPNVGMQGMATLKSLKDSSIEDDNKRMFIFGPETLGRQKISSTNGYSWDKEIKNENYKNVNSYDGILNPYNEYIFNKRDEGLVKELAKHNYRTSSNINWEYTDESKGDHIAEETPYFDDVHGYSIVFNKNKNGDPVVSASDLYDFDKNYGDRFAQMSSERTKLPIGIVKPIMEAQRRALNLVGHPYILRQDNIPIKFTDNPQGSEIYRTNHLTQQILDNLSDEDIAKITKSGYINPAIIESK